MLILFSQKYFSRFRKKNTQITRFPDTPLPPPLTKTEHETEINKLRKNKINFKRCR